MPRLKRVKSTKNNKRIKSVRKKKFFLGRTEIGVLFVLLFVVIFSVALVFLGSGLSPKSEVVDNVSITCCDSGDGDNCKPLENRTIEYESVATSYYAIYQGDVGNGSRKDKYALLKTNAIIRSQKDGHIFKDPKNQISPEGYSIHYNRMGDVQDGAHAPDCEAGLRDTNKTKRGQSILPGTTTGPMDPIYGGGLDPDEGKPGCYLIPDDELIYVCRPDNATPYDKFDNADIAICTRRDTTPKYNVYYRVKDLAGFGIHDKIKNCMKPELTVTPGQSGQKIVTPPRSTAPKQNLQLETFDVVNNSESVPTDWVSPYCKPAIYLYPEFKELVHVKINPVGTILYSIPKYPADGWLVWAYPDGTIYSGLEKYDYLYYEVEIPDSVISLPDKGFVKEYKDLSVFLPKLVTKLGLNQKERDQFVDYWLGVLPKVKYYQIKIVEQTVLNSISPLSINPHPDTVIRVTLHFTPLDEKVEFQEPVISSVRRDGFAVVEWGGIVKRGKHNFSCFM